MVPVVRYVLAFALAGAALSFFALDRRASSKLASPRWEDVILSEEESWPPTKRILLRHPSNESFVVPPPSEGNYSYLGPRFLTTQNLLKKFGFRATWNYYRDFGSWPACEWKTLCVSRFHRVGILAATAPLSPADENTQDTKSPMARLLCSTHSYVQLFNASTRLPGPNDSIVWLPGTTLLIDSYIRWHFYHEVAVALQTRGLLESLALRNQSVDRTLWLLQKGAPFTGDILHSAREELLNGVISKYLSRSFSVFREPDLYNWGMVCMERVVQVTGMWTKMFSDELHLARWNDFRKSWNPSGGTGIGQCPGDSVVFLSRSDGQFDRSVRNFALFDHVLREVGICNYTNATYFANSSLAFQVRLFESYGLLMSVHSAQLTNVIFSHPLSATLEIVRISRAVSDATGDLTSSLEQLEGRENISPYCTAGFCPTLYNVSFGHMHSHTTHRRGFAWIHGRILMNDLSHLMQRQREALLKAGCKLPTYLQGQNCTATTVQ